MTRSNGLRVGKGAYTLEDILLFEGIYTIQSQILSASEDLPLKGCEISLKCVGAAHARKYNSRSDSCVSAEASGREWKSPTQ